MKISKNKCKTYCYEFVPYKKIGQFTLDKKMNENDFKPSGCPFLYENGINHVLCRAIGINNPFRPFKNEDKVFFTYNNNKIQITSVFDDFERDLKAICSDLVIDYELDDSNSKWIFAYSKSLGIIIASNEFQSKFLIQSLRFVGKNVFIDIINEHFREDSNVKKNNNLEEKNMNLFNDKKYDIDEKENVPQFVYGIPDTMRKQWEEIDKKIDENCIFDAFEGDYFGPSYYYFINEYENKYYFRFGYSKDGRRIENTKEDTNIHELSHNKEYYDSFVVELKTLIKDWNSKYVNKNVMDGTQWHIQDNNKIYIYGSNEFPNNYSEYVELLKKYFNVNMYLKEENKYEIDPEDNVPREVYGIPRPQPDINKYDVIPEENVPQRIYDVLNVKQNNDNLLKDIIKVRIKLDNTSYIIMLDKIYQPAAPSNYNSNLFFVKGNLKENFIGDVSVNIPINEFENYKNIVREISQNWDMEKNNYKSTKFNIEWQLEQTIRDKNYKFSGINSVPYNWNEFINLISELEMMFKALKK